MVKKSWR